MIEREFLDHSAKKLEQYTERIGTCLGMLNDEQVWARGNTNENAIGNLVLHLCGNVRQWIVCGLGGATDTRDRDSEFAQRDVITREELLARVRRALSEADAALANFNAARLLDKHTIQGCDVSGLEAILHVVEHFSMHTGQIILLTKALTARDLKLWEPPA